MPYKLRKAPKRELYWVITTETGKKHSKLPIALDKAKAQMRILEAALTGAGVEEEEQLRQHLASLSADPDKISYKLFGELGVPLDTEGKSRVLKNKDPMDYPPGEHDFKHRYFPFPNNHDAPNYPSISATPKRTLAKESAEMRERLRKMVLTGKYPELEKDVRRGEVTAEHPYGFEAVNPHPMRRLLGDPRSSKVQPLRVTEEEMPALKAMLSPPEPAAPKKTLFQKAMSFLKNPFKRGKGRKLKGGNLREQRDFLITRANRLHDQIQNYNQLNRDTTELNFQLYNILQRIQTITTQLAGEDEDPQGLPPAGEDASEDPSGLGKNRKLKGGVTAEQLRSIKKDVDRIFPAIRSQYSLNLNTGKITRHVRQSEDSFALIDAALQHWITPSEYAQIIKTPEYKNFRDFIRVTDFIDEMELARRIAGTKYFREFNDLHDKLLDLFRQLNLAPLGSRERELIENKIHIAHEKFIGRINSMAWGNVQELLMGPGVKVVKALDGDYTYVSSPAPGRREFLPYPVKGRGKKYNGGMVPVRNPMLVLAAERKAKESIKLELDQSNAAVGFANGNYSMEEILQLAIKSLTRKGEAEAVAYINRLIQEHSGNPNFKVKRPEARQQLAKEMGFAVGGKKCRKCNKFKV